MNTIISEFKKTRSLKGIKILIIGYGVTGKALESFCLFFGATVWIYDSKKVEKTNYLGLDKLEIKDFDLALKSPGVPWENDCVKLCENREITISGEIELVSQVVDVPIIGVTGTNGKSTVVKMISDGLNLAGISHFLGGNYGIPFSCIIDKEYSDIKYIVLELSSFQLELIESFKADFSIITNIFPHHMERYKSFEEYKKTKEKILLHSKRIIPFEGELNFSRVKLRGEHNLENFRFAYSTLKKCGVSDEHFNKLVASFTGLEHRIEYCGELRNIHFYNDSKSTSLEATLTALKSFESGEVQLLCGGKLRTSDVGQYKLLLDYITSENIIVFGEAAQSLKGVLGARCVRSLSDYFDLQLFDESKNVLLSPGFPSYDQYKNFEERGQHFKSLLKEYL